MKKIIAYYKSGAYGMGQYYPEDDWYNEHTVKNANDIFEFLKECFKMNSAYDIADKYVDLHDIKYFEIEYDICNLGHTHIQKRIIVSRPEYEDEGIKMFEEWEKRVKKKINVFQNICYKNEQEEKDLKEFERLKAKFN